MKTINVKITHYPDMYCECCEWNSYKDLSITCGGNTRSYTQNDHWGGEWDGSYEELYQFALESVIGEPYIIEDWWCNYYDDGSPYEYATGLLSQNPVRLVIKEDLQYLVVNGKTYVTLFNYEEESLVGVITGMVRLLGYSIEIEDKGKG